MALPFLLSLGLPALGAATGGLGLGLGAASLAGIGAGLGSFLQTGDVGKGIQTGLIAGLGGKLMSSATSALGSAGAQAVPQAVTAGGLPAATGSKLLNATLGKDLLAKKLGETTVAGALGAAGSGFGTGLIADAMNPQTMELPGREKVDIPPPMPRIRSYQPKTDMSSTAEETMISYGPPMAKPEVEAELPFANYVKNYRPPAGMYGNMFAEGGEVKKMRGGGLMSISSSHPIFKSFGENMAGFLTNQQIESNREKLQPFVQEVETLAKTTFGDDAFQQKQFLSGTIQPTGPAQLPIYDTLFESQPVDPFNIESILQPRPHVNRTQPHRLHPISRGPEDFAYNNPGSPLQGGMPATLQGFAEGGIVPEEMNEKELIEEAVAAIKGESDNPKEILGMFLLKFGEEQLRNLVESVQSGELDETRERFADGNKGMVNGPGDGSGKDDMVPATMDGDQDVLLTAGEFVIKKDSTDAIEKAFGGGFLDEVNDAGKDAPKKLKREGGSCVRVSTVPKETVKHVWSDVEELLKKSVADTSRGKIDLIDILNGILTDVYVLWVVLDEEDNMVAAITTRIATYPRRKSMVLDFVGGAKLHKWKDTVIETIGRFAKENDCQHLEGYGRKGWERALRGNGFYSEYIAYRMEL